MKASNEGDKALNNSFYNTADTKGNGHALFYSKNQTDLLGTLPQLTKFLNN